MKLSVPGKLLFYYLLERRAREKAPQWFPADYNPDMVDDYAKRLSEAMGEAGFTAASPVQDAPDLSE